MGMDVHSTISLYIHIPFCEQKCGYCDFNSYAGLEGLMVPYVEALCRELAIWSGALGRPQVATVYFGGGTPSLLPLPLLEQVMEAVQDGFRCDGLREVSLEANPGTVDLAYLKGLRALGVNRLSIGVQSFHDDELRFLGRLHSARQAQEAYAWARKAGFDNVNLDLIFGIPGQGLPRWRRNLRKAITLAPEHLSLYALTVEERTPLAHQVARGEVPAPDPDLQGEMYEWAQGAMAQAGYEHYEISNWALPGRRCLHNLSYWRMLPYLGVGAGAHSCLWDGERYYRFWNVYSPRRYVRAVGGACPDSPSPLRTFLGRLPFVGGVDEGGPRQALAEAVILGLRLLEGVDMGQIQSRFGQDLRESYGATIDELSSLGLLLVEDHRLRLSQRGLLLANEVMAHFL
jgi:oxygen-independent coproporphyrinogen-3 oxidase